MICSQITNSCIAGKKNNYSNSIIVNGCPGPFPSEEESIELTTFPIDLDLLFYQDNLTMFNFILNNVGNYSTIWPVTPWNGHFHSGHVEGADRWYLYSYRRLPIRAPHEGVYNKEKPIGDGSIFSYNSQDLVSNLGLTIDLGNDFNILFGHIDLLESIYDEIQSTGTYSFEENELIGYNHNWTGFFSVDFHLMYKYHDLCPLQYLSSELQSDLLYYYNLIYERAIVSGLYPESKICNNHTIEIENTVWGVWEYETGPYDEEFNNPEIEAAFGGWTFLNRNLSNSETFYRDIKTKNWTTGDYQNLTDDIIGVFADSFPQEILDYKKLDYCLIKLAEGNYEVGIFELINNYENEWGPSNTSVFAKFSLANHDAGPEDDILTLEFFADLVSAQAGFTNDNLTLTRHYHFHSEEVTTSRFDSFSAIIVIGVISVIVIVRKRKKRITE